MKVNNKNIAYIDGANLHNAILELGWKMDYKKFRVWLSDKYGVEKAYIFIGYMRKYEPLYKILKEGGYKLIFKEVVYGEAGKPKGNCDEDLVLKVVSDIFESDVGKIILVSSDGDYSSLVKFLMKKDKLLAVLSPSLPYKCSILLKKTGAKIAYLNDQKNILRK